MKIVYMGTPDFAVPSLEALVRAGHEVACVVTQPDAVRDRGKKIKYSPVKEKALELGIPVLQPVKVRKDAEFLQQMQQIAPDLIAVAAYGQILPKEILELPEYGCLNVHGSLLPRFRGAAPIQRYHDHVYGRRSGYRGYAGKGGDPCWTEDRTGTSR